MKTNYLFILICFLSIISCNEEIKEQHPDLSDFKIVQSVEYLLSSSLDTIEYENPNSHLWVDDELLTKSVPSFRANPSKTQYLSTEKIGYSDPNPCDSRFKTNFPYLQQSILYIAQISIPKGYSLILPPPEIMSTYTPMGLNPTVNYKWGYSHHLIRSTANEDIYELRTKIYAITHDAYGRQVALNSNPIYPDCKMQNPNDIVFRYQYSNIEW